MSWLEKNKSEEFYANFPEKLVRDYLNGNRRTEAAIRFFLSQIEKINEHVLDIGCGIGWSSYEMSLNIEGDVTGIDLSENSIKAGQEIFKKENLNLLKGDILIDDYQYEKFDVISFLDVFEHIPENKRETVYHKIDKLLKHRSKVLLTCPTVYHQNYLKKNYPESIQPVDEDITLSILKDFANKINGEISFFSYKSIWNTNDYFHCCIERGLSYNESIIFNNNEIEDVKERIRKIKETKWRILFEKEIQEFNKKEGGTFKKIRRKIRLRTRIKAFFR